MVRFMLDARNYLDGESILERGKTLADYGFGAFDFINIKWWDLNYSSCCVCFPIRDKCSCCSGEPVKIVDCPHEISEDS